MGQLPTGVAITPDHHIVAVEGEHCICIKKFTFDGKCVEISEQIDAGRPPHDVAVDSKGQIYVPIRDGIKVLHPNLAFSHHFSEHMKRPYRSYRIAIDSHDNVYICNSTGLYKFACDGTCMRMKCLYDYSKDCSGDIRIDPLPYIPYTVAVDPYDRVHLMSTKHSKVATFNHDAIVKWCSTNAHQPCGIAVDSKGDAYLTYMYK